MKKDFKIKMIIAVFFSIIIGLLLRSCKDPKPTKESLHKKQIESLFMYNGGPHKGAFNYLSNQLNDPESLDNIRCIYVEDTISNIVSVKWQFTAKNAFGGRVRHYVIFDSDTLGNIVKVHKWVE